MKLYSNGYIDYKSGKIISNETLFDNFNDVKYDLNWKILGMINEIYDIHLENKVLYSLYIDSYNSCEKNIKIDYKKSLKIIKKDNTLDVFLKIINNGYIYNNNDTKHIYKFFINTHEINDVTSMEGPSYLKKDTIYTEEYEHKYKNNNKVYSKLMIELSEKIKHLKTDT